MAWPKGKSRKPVEDSGVAVLDEPTDAAQGLRVRRGRDVGRTAGGHAPPPAPPAVTATPPAPLCCPTCGQSCTPDMLPQGKFFECISANWAAQDHPAAPSAMSGTRSASTGRCTGSRGRRWT